MRSHRPLALIIVIAALALLAAGRGSQMTSDGSHAIPGGQAAGHAQRPAHLIVVMEENHSFEQIIGSPAAPFLNRLAVHGTLLTQYYAVTHPSLPNYVALLSGRTPIGSDCRACTFAGPTLIDQLEARHISWAAYFQGLPRPCSTVPRHGAYTEAVDPFMHAADIRHHPTRCDRVLPFHRFHADLAAGRLPAVVFVMPDLHHEMHSGPVRVADAWLQRLVGELEAAPVWRQDTRLVVTFDESTRPDVRSCCDGLGRGGRIATIVAGPRIPQGGDATRGHDSRRVQPAHRHHPGGIAACEASHGVRCDVAAAPTVLR